MKIQEKDFFHGAALTQIVEHPSFKALNKVDKKYGHYQINDDKRILLKYRSRRKGPWNFILEEKDINTLIEDIASNQESFLCLVCGETTICILTTNQYQELIDTSMKTSQRITVESPPRSRIKVKSQLCRLGKLVKHNSFPNIIFKSDIM
jgi:hypothetical protein